MTKIQAYLPPELYLELKIEAQKEKVNFSQLLREIAQSYLQKKRKQKKLNIKSLKFVTVKDPAFENLKPEEISKKIDEIVYG
jgi:metal-responsive CopG/Arc/MetJ family transcriptional regulator